MFAAALTGAAGPFTGLRAGRSRGRSRRISRRRRTFQGLLACREQRKPTLTPLRQQQYLPRGHGPDGDANGLFLSTPLHADDPTT